MEQLQNRKETYDAYRVSSCVALICVVLYSLVCEQVF